MEMNNKENSSPQPAFAMQPLTPQQYPPSYPHSVVQISSPYPPFPAQYSPFVPQSIPQGNLPYAPQFPQYPQFAPPVVYAPSPALPTPVVPAQTTGYTPLEVSTENKYQNLTFGEQLKVLPANTFYALTGNVIQLRERKLSASSIMVVILYAILLLYTYFIFRNLAGFILPLIIVGSFFFQTCIFGSLGYCMRGPNASQNNSFLHFCYLTILFGIPCAMLSSLAVLNFSWSNIFVSVVSIYSIVLYIFALRAVYDVSPCATIGIVLVYIIVCIGIVFITVLGILSTVTWD